jgi:hypothetical protein
VIEVSSFLSFYKLNHIIENMGMTAGELRMAISTEGMFSEVRRMLAFYTIILDI